MKAPRYASTTDVLDALLTIQTVCGDVRKLQAAELSEALNAVWEELNDGGKGVPGYEDKFSLSTSGVAKQIRDEYSLD